MPSKRGSTVRIWLGVLAKLVGEDAPVTRWSLAALELFEGKDLPSPERAAKAAKSVIAHCAVDDANGNITQAANALKISRPTLRSALAGFEIPAPPDIWENQAMGTYDDSLFPFIRTRWDAEPTEAFIEEYRDWALNTILPRCAKEGVKAVVLEDCSAWTKLPPLKILTKLVSVTGDTDALVRTHVHGIIGFMPNMGWVSWFNPMLSLTAIPHRFASTKDQALDFANELFQNGGAVPPSNLSID